VDRPSFDRLRAIALKEAGIALAESKQALVEARVGRRLRALGLEDARAYVQLLDGDHSGAELVHFLDAISTNFTSFFREAAHFDDLRAEIQHRRQAGQTRFRLWSAACSSGEEPYSMAMSVDDLLRGADWRLLATDLSTRVLAHAQRAIYPAEVVEKVPRGLRERHFVRAAGDEYQVAPALRERITFRRLNLTSPFPMQGPLDVVFCCNVMIYFDREVRRRLVAEITRLLAPGGLLIISHSESLSGINPGLAVVRPSVYRKPGESA
jgi:chemotaxis protein methyltransferase CheR